MKEWMNERSKKNIKLCKTETRNVVYNCVKCMMKIKQFRQANIKEIGCRSFYFDWTWEIRDGTERE